MSNRVTTIDLRQTHHPPWETSERERHSIVRSLKGLTMVDEGVLKGPRCY